MSIPALHARIVGESLGGGGAVFAGSRWAGLRALDRLGQFLELGGQGLQLGGERLGIGFGEAGGGVEQGFEHHRDARQDRLLDPLERLFEARLLLFRLSMDAILAASG